MISKSQEEAEEQHKQSEMEACMNKEQQFPEDQLSKYFSTKIILAYSRRYRNFAQYRHSHLKIRYGLTS